MRGRGVHVAQQQHCRNTAECSEVLHNAHACNDNVLHALCCK